MKRKKKAEYIRVYLINASDALKEKVKMIKKICDE
jgi:hypothetical protein